MSSNRIAVLLVLLLFVGSYFGYNRWSRWYHNPARLEKVKQAQQVKKEETREKAIDAAQEKDHTTAVEKMKKDLSSPESKIRAAFNLSPKQRYPLSEKLSILTEAAPLPKDLKPAPVLFFAPLFSVSSKITSPTVALESIMRFHLRPCTPGPVALNLIPFSYMVFPYQRADGDTNLERNRKPDDYLRDAQLIGANVLVYGRADELQGNIVLQLAMMDLRTSQSDSWSVTVPPAQLPTALATGLTKIATFSGVNEQGLKTLGLTPEIAAKTLPTGAALESVLAADFGKRNIDSARSAIAAAGPECPWLYEQHIQTMKGDSAVELANDALKRWPDDPRFLLSKAQVMSASREYFPSHVILSEFVHRQPDSLEGACWLRLSLREIFNYNENHVLLPAGYRGALSHISQLLALYPQNWALRWDRATCAGNTFVRAETLLYNDAYTRVTSEPQKLKKEQVEELAKQFETLPLQVINDLKSAAERRPDCPGLIVDQLSWHQQLTDGEGEDDPAVAIKWQYPLLARLAILDPKNVEGDLIVADEQARTTESDQLKILKDAAERTKQDPKVMMRLALSAAKRLFWRVDWAPFQTYDTKVLKGRASSLAGLPETEFYYQAVVAGIDADEFLSQENGAMCWLIPYVDRKYESLGAKFYNYKNRHFKASNAAMKESNWQEALTHARRVVEVLPPEDTHAMRYNIVKSLWQMKHLREALYEAEVGIEVLPNKHTFHYLFAIIALELDDRLEEAYERIKIAAELDPKNGGVHETMAKLAKRLGR